MKSECPKCGAQMVIGTSVDYTYGGKMQSRWVEGEAEQSFWSGLKTRHKPMYKTDTYRCQRCGYLESYAIDKIEESVFE